MAADLRHARRVRLDRRCWIVVGGTESRRECLVQDISQNGARVTLPPGTTLPKAVDLYLTSEGAVVRKSEVIWQTANEAGLQFLDRPQVPAASGASRRHSADAS